MDSFSEYLKKLVNSNQPNQQEKSLEENISILKKTFCTKDEITNKPLRPNIQFLTLYRQSLTISIQTL